MTFCKECGQALEDNAIVCTNCNTAVETVGEAPVNEIPAVNVGANFGSEPVKKKSIFKKWWFWLAVVLVAAIVVVAAVSIWQKAFIDYNNEEYKVYMDEAKQIDNLIGETLNANTLSEAKDIWASNDVKGRMDALLSDAKAYDSDNENIAELHSLTVKSLEKLSEIVAFVDAAVGVGSYYPDDLENMYAELQQISDERDAMWKKLVDKYKVTIK